MIGKTLAHYTVTGKLGEGGMGEVYRARDDRLGREVALKVLPPGVASSPERLARFRREARVVAGLNHPNVVTLYSIEEAEGVHFLTMELVEGQSLDAVIATSGLSLSRLLELSLPLAEALVAAHERGVIHRDLKPANVMVAADGRIKVLDFGLAKLAGPEPEANLTQAATMKAPISSAGQMLGTVPYMAPEQIRGKPVDARADVFALGIILYELAAGRRPFAGASSADVTSAILRDPPKPLGEVRQDLPEDLGRIVSRCLEKDPDRRFQTAKDVRNELDLLKAKVSSRVSAPAATRTMPSAEDAPSIAVLPFANRSRDEEDEYFSDGLADELLSVLAKIRGLRVAARTSSASFKGKEVTIEEVGRALGVATVLEGSVRKAGNRVRIAVQLVKVSDGYPLWSETYDRTLEDIFAVQDDISRSVVKELRTTLLGETPDSDASGEARAEVAAAARGRGRNAEAHRLYLQGKHLVSRINETDTARGIEYLRQAVELDPSHAGAWVSLSTAYGNQGGWGWGPVEESNKKARDAAERAISLAPESAEAHVNLARIHRQHDYDWAGAEASVRRALELAPAGAEVLREAGVLAGQLGRTDEAIRYLEEAAVQDPLSTMVYSNLGYAYRCAGRYLEAIDALYKSLELSPQRIAAYHLIAVCHAEQGQDAEAMTAVMEETAEWARLTGLAYAHCLAGRTSESRKALEELEQKYSEESALQIAAVHSALGDADKAFHWLDRAHAQHDAGAAQTLMEPSLRPLHSDPRWDILCRKLGFIP